MTGETFPRDNGARARSAVVEAAQPLNLPPPAEPLRIDGMTIAEARAARRAANRLKPPVLKELGPKHRLLIAYMVHGCPHSYVSRFTRPCPTDDDEDAERPLRQNEPLRLEEAAKVMGMRVRQARDLFGQVVFQRALNAEVQKLRDGAKIAAMRTAIGLLEHQGEGKAADAKVRLDAAKFVLGEGQGGGTSVSVNVGVGGAGSQPLRAGVVIRLKTNAPQAPIEAQAIIEEQEDAPGFGRMIDVTPSRVDDDAPDDGASDDQAD